MYTISLYNVSDDIDVLKLKIKGERKDDKGKITFIKRINEEK